jgi:hypothetical protein
MVKLIMSWNIKSDEEPAYFEFVVQEFARPRRGTPSMAKDRRSSRSARPTIVRRSTACWAVRTGPS